LIVGMLFSIPVANMKLAIVCLPTDFSRLSAREGHLRNPARARFQ
jgi:hypothetical protein